MKFSWRTELPPLLLLFVLFALSAWAWPRLPESVPVHFGLDGRPDRFGSRAEGVLVTPVVAVILYLLFSVFPRLDPGRENYASFAGVYFRIRLAVLAFMTAIHAAVLIQLQSAEPRVMAWVLVLIGALLFFIGTQIGHLAPNWFMGVRTPWTLSSPSTWKRTNRVGGFLMMAEGVLFVLAGIVNRPWSLAVAIGLLLAGVIGVVVYSYVVWRDAPDKSPPAPQRGV